MQTNYQLKLTGTLMDETPLILKIALIEKDNDISELILPVFKNIPQVQEIKLVSSKEEIANEFIDGKYNSLLINIFSIGVDQGLRVIESVRKSSPDIPICLVGNAKDFIFMKGVPQKWRKRFEHYYKLPIDVPSRKFLVAANDITRLLSLYLLSRIASVRLRDLKTFFESRGENHINDQKESIKESFNIVETALQAKEGSELKNKYIIPGFDTNALNELVNDTLQKASKSLERATYVNMGILIFGGVLVALSFIVAIFKGSWEAVTFGGFGIAGIITSLITNPSKSVTSAAKRLVQIQVAYLGFINILGFYSDDSAMTGGSVTNRTEMLNTAISNVLENLEKHCR